ncbi:uncharacterized protein RINTU1_06390 [Candidatus Regiella insecticola]|uniref:Uncharacterized protein n=1 Tax=Candidatus Regiella insecticola TaxID=138073 RepID=A0A6L2ZM09_9ENTR|nr:uncharacterized protein RINTU1_06390 [Candidatus Regiella insecticola]
MRFAIPLKNQTNGRKTIKQKRMGLTTRTAIASGAIMPMRFGVRSANKMNRLVTKTNAKIELICTANSEGIEGIIASRNTVNEGEKAASPTIPARIATALRPICTTVKKVPGVACIFRTCAALTSPSSAIIFNFILRDAASEISDKEKKALTAMRKRINSILFNIKPLEETANHYMKLRNKGCGNWSVR